MANLQIHELAQASSVSGADQLAVSLVSGNLTRRVTGDALRAPTDRRHHFDVAAYGAVGDGVTDDTTAIAAAMTAARARPWLDYKVLEFPYGAYLIGDGTIFTNCNRLILNFNGSSLKNTVGSTTFTNPTLLLGRPNFWKIISDPDADRHVEQGTASAGYFLNTANDGDTAVTLSTASDDSNFSVGDWVFIYARAGQLNGFPPNPLSFQYAQVTGVSTGVLTLDRRLIYTYADDAADSTFSPDPVSAPTLNYGAARIINLTTNFVADYIEVNDLVTIPKDPGGAGDNLGGMTCGAVRAVFRNVTTEVILPTMVGNLRITECNLVGIQEMDKCVELLEYDRCLIDTLQVGGGVANLRMTDTTVVGQVGQSRPWSQYIDRCDLQMVDSAATCYMTAAARQPRNRFRLVESTVRVPSTRNFTIASFFTPSTDTGLFGASITVSGAPTNLISIPGWSEVLEATLVVGQRFIAEKSGGGVCYGRITGIRKNGTALELDVVCSGTMVNAGLAYPEWTLTPMEYYDNNIIGAQGGDTVDMQDVFSVENRGRTMIIRGKFNPYQVRNFPSWRIGCVLDYWRVNVRKAYTGVDNPCFVTLGIGTIDYDGATAFVEKHIDVRTVGTRVLYPARSEVLGADTATALTGAGGVYLLWAYNNGVGFNSITGDINTTPNEANMPRIDYELQISRLPDFLFG